MKKINFRKICIVALSMIMLCMTACGKKEEDKKETVKPDIMQVRSLSNLATLECYYHNVSKSVKSAGSGPAHIGEADRKFWFEYSGKVKLGIDMSLVTFDFSEEDKKVVVHMPKAKIISIDPVFDESTNVIVSNDDALPIIGIVNKSAGVNDIKSEDVAKAFNNSEASIREQIENDSSLLLSAEERAEKLIKNYFDQLGNINGVTYDIVFETIEE